MPYSHVDETIANTIPYFWIFMTRSLLYSRRARLIQVGGQNRYGLRSLPVSRIWTNGPSDHRVNPSPLGAQDEDIPEAPLPLQCPFCSAAFPLRKHLGAHIWPDPIRSGRRRATLRTRSTESTATPATSGLARSGNYNNIFRCLIEAFRVSHLLPPMTLEQIKREEEPETRREKQLHQGVWHVYTGIQQQSVLFGPTMPTEEERYHGLDFLLEEVPISELQRTSRPTAEVLKWVSTHVGARSTEGPRTTSKKFGTCCLVFRAELLFFLDAPLTRHYGPHPTQCYSLYIRAPEV